MKIAFRVIGHFKSGENGKSNIGVSKANLAKVRDRA